MVDLGKCRIRQLRNYQAKMMMADNFDEFHELFGPFDENFASDLADKLPMPKLKIPEGSAFDPASYLPPGIPNEELNKIEAEQDLLINPPPP